MQPSGPGGAHEIKYDGYAYRLSGLRTWKRLHVRGDSATAALPLLMRTGLSTDYKRGLLKRLWEVFQDATSAPDDQIVIGRQEVPPSQAMEMAQIMPDVSDH
jgi:hypothetical protein